jgi:hypothetical protein
MNLKLALARVFAASITVPLLAQSSVTGGTPGLGGPDKSVPLPPTHPQAGGKIVPQVGTHQLKKIASAYGGVLPSAAMKVPNGTIPPQNPAPLGWLLTDIFWYLPDTAPPGQSQAALKDHIRFHDDHEYPDTFEMGNSDPSGSLDGTALDAQGNPIQFNLHWPPEPAKDRWLSDIGIDCSSPTDDLQEILDYTIQTGSKDRIQEALDILLGTNVSGALANKAYKGFNLLKIYKAKNNKSYDPIRRNVHVTQLWYDTEIYSDSQLLEIPPEGDFTITWHFRGLGDIGPNREKAFPIDEAAPHLMRETINGDFWISNAWIWKWFNMVIGPHDRKFHLSDLYAAHTGTSNAPSYSQINPNDKRYWLHADRKFDMGRYIGEGNPYDQSRMRSLDLNLDGKIGGYLVDGTNTGAAYSATTNPQAQFNQYGNNEYAVPVIDWSTGAIHAPYFSMDSTFTTVTKGKESTAIVRYSNGEALEGIYNWGWRIHPPRINWIETYGTGQILPSGALKEWRFGNKWDEVEQLGLAAVGEHAPEKRIHAALVAYQASAGTPADVQALKDGVAGMMRSLRDRRYIPPVSDIAGFPNPNADINFLYTNLDIYGDRAKASPKGKLSWHEGEVIKICIHNDDAVTRFFRVVDFGTSDYQYVGTDMGLLDWKPVFGVPQIVANAWRPKKFTTTGWGAQGLGLSYWIGTDLEGQGNPFQVDSSFNDPLNYWWAGERDLVHDWQRLDGFSGPGFVPEFSGQPSVWGNDPLAGLPTGSPGMWDYAYGRPIPPKTTVTFEIEMPRAMALNNGAMYMFDPQFHASAVFTMHPESELQPEGLDD